MLQMHRQQLLMWLAQYGFLCVSQFQELGVRKSKKTIRSYLSSLQDRNWTDRRVFQFGPEIGRVEDMHYLLPKGKKYLMDELGRKEEQITLPRGPKSFHADYRHRKMTIHVHIALRKTLEHHARHLFRADVYFSGDKRTGNNKRTATAMQIKQGVLKADLILAIGQQTTPRQLWCVELHRGQRVLKIYDQRRAYVQALALGSASMKYGLEIPSRVLTVFEHASTMHTAIERTQHDPLFRHLTPYFLSTSYEHLHNNSADKRLDLHGQSQSLIS